MFAPGTARLLVPAAPVLGLLTVVSFLTRSPLAIGICLAAVALWAFLVVFFRDPERTPGPGIVSAADGRILSVEVSGDRLLISVFMSVGDVHVNRFPIDAVVDSIEDRGSRSRPAYRADAHHNRQRSYRLESAIGPVEVVQMTGAVARRLVAFVRPGEPGAKGTRLGMIVLGSRVDVLLPAARARALVRIGDRVRAGSSSIAEILPGASP